MKVFLTVILILLIIIVLAGARFRKPVPVPVVEKEPIRVACRGYTVIEAGKGVDCNGDTVKLVKKNGFYERVNTLQSMLATK